MTNGADESDRAVGAVLGAARLNAGLTLTELAERVKVRPSIIDAIERGEGDLLLPRVYVRGHVQALAGILGLDAAALVDRLRPDRGS